MVKQWFASSACAPAAGVKALAFIGLLYLAGPPVQAAEPSPLPSEFLGLPTYDLEAAPSQAKIGDEIPLKLRGYPVDKSYTLTPAPGDADLSGQGWVVEARPKGTIATPVKPGHLTLPSLEVLDAAGKPVARTNPLILDVASAIPSSDPKPSEPVPAVPPLGLRFPWWVLVLIWLGAVAVAGGVGYGLYRWAKKRKPARVEPAPPPKPEDEAALEALSGLERAGFLARGEFKKHYFALSDIVKTYIGARFRFDAPESTTFEMISYLEQRKVLSDTLLDRIESMFALLDRVKFSDHVPSSDEGGILIAEARELVQGTRRPPPTPAPEAHALR